MPSLQAYLSQFLGSRKDTNLTCRYHVEVSMNLVWYCYCSSRVLLRDGPSPQDLHFQLKKYPTKVLLTVYKSSLCNFLLLGVNNAKCIGFNSYSFRENDIILWIFRKCQLHKSYNFNIDILFYWAALFFPIRGKRESCDFDVDLLQLHSNNLQTLLIARFEQTKI